MIRRPWAVPYRTTVSDSLDEPVEELAPVTLTALVGVLALALQDRHELWTSLEESTPFADALEDTAK